MSASKGISPSTQPLSPSPVHPLKTQDSPAAIGTSPATSSQEPAQSELSESPPSPMTSMDSRDKELFLTSESSKSVIHPVPPLLSLGPLRQMTFFSSTET